MSSTNKTTNYELSQFLGNDKPAWLSDYNTDMSKIDTQMKANADAATAASGSATSANTAIGTLASLTTDEKNTLVGAINEVDAHADTAQNTANSATSTATSASSKADQALAQIENFNLTSNATLTASTTNGTMSVLSLSLAKNSDGSLAKFYGSIYLTGLTNNPTITTSDTGLRPSEAITFNGCALAERFDSGGAASIFPLSYTLNTNGTITIEAYGNPTSCPNTYLLFTACLLYIKQFGDVPVTPEA